MVVFHLSALSFQGYPGLDGAKGETGAVGSKVQLGLLQLRATFSQTRRLSTESMPLPYSSVFFYSG